MIHTKRTTVILALLGLLAPVFSQAGQSPDVASKRKLIISGYAGLGDVIMKGLPGNPVTDATGQYHVQVEYGWQGTVRPTKEGFTFEPAAKTYTELTADFPDENYVARVITFRISGSVGLANVAMHGLPDEVIADESGVYVATVPYGWSGTVAPEKAGYLFTPRSRVYQKVMAEVRNQDYQAEIRMVTISDQLTYSDQNTTEPVPGVLVTAEPSGQTATTDAQGQYSIRVPYGWTGRLILSKRGFGFDSSFNKYTNVTSDIVKDKLVPSSSQRPATPPRYPGAVMPSAEGKVFVIPTAQVDPEKFAQTEEDMRIMLQILQEKLDEPRTIRGVLMDFGSFGRDRTFEAFHLQGCAVVFVLEMDSPFSFTPPQSGEGEPQKEAVDPIWQRARQRLYSPGNPAMRASPGETEKMDFEQFKTDLLQTLRHAANLRHVEPNDLVILTIMAKDEESSWPAPASAGGAYSGGGGAMGGGAWFEGSSYSTASGSFGPTGGSTHADSRTQSRGSTSGRSVPIVDQYGNPRLDPMGRPMMKTAPAPSATVLTIHAKKADIDAFAKDGLTFELFQQRVKIFTY